MQRTMVSVGQFIRIHGCLPFLFLFPGTLADTASPTGIREDQFDELVARSPFLRLIRPEEVYALRGIATVDQVTIVTLHHRKTGKSLLLVEGEENELGMKVVDVAGIETDERVVKILFSGQEAEFSYDSEIINPESIPGRRDKIRYDKEGRVSTSEELVKKFMTLSKEQRAIYLRWKEQVQLKARPELRYSKERFPYAHRALDAIKRGERPEDPRIRR